MQKYLSDSLLSGHTICISEGSAEDVIINKLFNANKLIFKNNDLHCGNRLIRDFSRTRNGKKFARENLQKDYGNEHLNILRILDSKNESFKLGKVYDEKLKNKEIRVFDILTKPEIEILVIIHEGEYQRYTNSFRNLKPSEFCMNKLGMKKVKNEAFISSYFYDIDTLMISIKEYYRLSSRKSEYSLYDLIDKAFI